jgi:murein DD-endopeptidase MepM/ murein hydrolase activator NlpD
MTMFKPTITINGMKYLFTLLAFTVTLFTVAEILKTHNGGEVLSISTNAPSVAPAAKETINPDDQALTLAFLPIQKSSKYPVIGRNIHDVNSGFGPRVKVASGGRYDWHRGIDTGNSLGEQVINAYDGTFEGINVYPDGGITVTVRHTFPTPLVFKGKTLSYFYTLYMHLNKVDSALVTASQSGKHPILAAGAKIGLMGSTGATDTNALHLDVRVGTQCSLEYQIQNPQSSCAKGYGFDSHVNPLLIFKPVTTDFSITKSTDKYRDFIILFRTADESAYLNRVEYQLLDKTTGQKIKSHILDFNTREGYNPAAVSLLDTQDTTNPYIRPIIFSSTSTEYRTHIVIPYSYWNTNGHTVSVLFVTDIWGNTKSLNWVN